MRRLQPSVAELFWPKKGPFEWHYPIKTPQQKIRTIRPRVIVVAGLPMHHYRAEDAIAEALCDGVFGGVRLRPTNARGAGVFVVTAIVGRLLAERDRRHSGRANFLRAQSVNKTFSTGFGYIEHNP
jgi:hypothetical protein